MNTTDSNYINIINDKGNSTSVFFIYMHIKK